MSILNKRKFQKIKLTRREYGKLLEELNVNKTEEVKHRISPLIYELSTINSEYDTLKFLNHTIVNLSRIMKYSTDLNNKLYGEIGYDSNFAEFNLNEDGMLSEDITKHLFRKNGIYIKNNTMKIFSLIPNDNHFEIYENVMENEKVILPLINRNEKITGVIVLEGEDLYAKYTHKDDMMGLLILLASAARRVSDNNELESDELICNIKNKKRINKRLNFALNSRIDKNEELWFLMIDIDFFKKINDNYGHDVGDVVLYNVGETILRNVKNNKITGERDEVFRFGGEEFCVIIKGNKNAARKAGDRIKRCIADKTSYTNQGHEIKVTCSIGIAEGTSLVKKYIEQGQNKEDALKNGINELIRKADGALYDAKRNGRNILIEAN
jgi:diguanylate cyclase (GGDEF)-like protein